MACQRALQHLPQHRWNVLCVSDSHIRVLSRAIACYRVLTRAQSSEPKIEFSGVFELSLISALLQALLMFALHHSYAARLFEIVFTEATSLETRSEFDVVGGCNALTLDAIKQRESVVLRAIGLLDLHTLAMHDAKRRADIFADSAHQAWSTVLDECTALINQLATNMDDIVSSNCTKHIPLMACRVQQSTTEINLWIQTQLEAALASLGEFPAGQAILP
jgi:hypothetical protein